MAGKEDSGKPQSNLRSFRLDQKEWDDFKALCRASKTTATAVLTKFIQQCNQSGMLAAAPQDSPSIDEMESSIDKRIDEKLQAAIAPLREEIAELKKPEATAA